MIKKLSLAAILLFSIASIANAQIYVDNFDDFKDSLTAAQPGDEIVLANGTYTARSITMEDVAGTAENPVIIRAEEIGGAILNEGTYFDLRHCSYITFQGFVINMSEKSTAFKVQTCNNIRITQNVIDGTDEDYYQDDGVTRNSATWVNIQSLWNDDTGLSHHNRMDHNRFQNKSTLGNIIRIDGTDEMYASQYDVIEYNHFLNMGPRADNEMEAIRIGWSAMSESDGFCTVSNNLFEECNGDPEIISVKCNKNTISHNTFRRCQGTLSLRHGNESLVEGNFFFGEGAEGTGGVRIYGSDHRIINNHFEGLTGTKWDAPITLTYGDADEGNSSLTKHFRIERAVIANNTLVDNDHGVEVGYDNNDNYSKPPRDVVLAYNLVTSDRGTLITYINQPTDMVWIDNLVYTNGEAVLSENVTLISPEIKTEDPQLASDGSMYRATATTPDYSPSSEAVGSVDWDIDGQLRSDPTNYGADEYSNGTIAYYPLQPSDVGPGQGEYLYLSPSSLNFPVAGGEGTISINSGLQWAISSNQDWLTADPTSGDGDLRITLTVAANETGLLRSAILTVTSTNAKDGIQLSETVLVNQLEVDPPALELSTSTLSFDATTGEQTLQITSNVSWTCSSDSDWITYTPENGENDATLKVIVKANESRSVRKGILTISDGENLVRSLEIEQDGSVGTEVKLLIVDAVATTEETSKGNVATNVFDGDLGTRWSGDGDGAHITLDLGGVQRVSFLNVGIYKGDSRSSYFDVQTSMDGESYFDALMGASTDLTEENMAIFDFNDTLARYVRLIGHGNSSNTWNSYTELEAWGWVLDPTVSTKSPGEPETLIYPNPSTGVFTVSGAQNALMSIYSTDGKKVLEHRITSNSESVHTSLRAGLYIIYIHQDEKDLQYKIMIRGTALYN